MEEQDARWVDFCGGLCREWNCAGRVFAKSGARLLDALLGV